MEEKITIRRMTRGDIFSLRKFFAEVYSSKHICTEEKHLLWHFDNPFGTLSSTHLSSIVATNSNGTILGFMGAVPTELYIQGDKILSIWLANWVTKKEAQGKGIGTGILKEMSKNRFLLASSMSQMAYPLYKKIGFVVLGKYSRLVYINNQERTLSLIRSMHPKEDVSNLESKKVTPKKVVSRNNKDIRIEWNKKFDEKEWDESWKEIRKRFGATVNRTSKYIHWRFIDHPYVKYHIGVARMQSGHVVGLAVIRIETTTAGTGFSIARVVDIVSVKKADQALVDGVIAFSKDNECDAIDLYTTCNEYEQVCRKQGFRLGLRMPSFLIPELFNPVALRARDPYKQTIIFKDSRLVKKHLLSPSQWHIVRADGDRDRAY